jgi:hypothetical protein
MCSRALVPARWRGMNRHDSMDGVDGVYEEEVFVFSFSISFWRSYPWA